MYWNKDLFVDKNVTCPDIEERIIEPFFKICEDQSLGDEQKKTAHAEIGLSDSPYGMSKEILRDILWGISLVGK